jgi:hypothetical protein
MRVSGLVTSQGQCKHYGSQKQPRCLWRKRPLLRRSGSHLVARATQPLSARSSSLDHGPAPEQYQQLGRVSRPQCRSAAIAEADASGR